MNGVLNVYKEKGFTSHDVVAKLRGITKQKKIGHTGTLDPDAEGVLPICLGKATKLCGMLTDKDKIYEAVLLLGKTTDTQDISGTVLEEKTTADLTEEMVMECIRSFIGEQEQIPPMYSALKVNGKKLYELAREGKEIERQARKITVYDITVIEMQLPRVRMQVHCSKGTYIRTICNDIGEKLGCGGCMESLLRTKVSCFEIKDSLKLQEIEALRDEGRLMDVMIPIDEMFSDYQKAVILKQFEKYAYNGNSFYKKDVREGVFVDGESVRIYDEEEHFIGIFQYRAAQDCFKVEKMFTVEKSENE